MHGIWRNGSRNLRNYRKTGSPCEVGENTSLLLVEQRSWKIGSIWQNALVYQRAPNQEPLILGRGITA